MKIILIIFILIAFTSYGQKYLSTKNQGNKYFKESLIGITYKYKDGYVMVKNNSKNSLAVLNISAKYRGNKNIKGVVIIENLVKGSSQKCKVDFYDLKDNKSETFNFERLKPKLLLFSFSNVIVDFL